MRVIVDTNVLVSGLISDFGAPAQIVNAILKGDILPVMSEATLAELEEVLHRPRIQAHFWRAAVMPFHLLSALEQIAHFVKPRPTKATSGTTRTDCFWSSRQLAQRRISSSPGTTILRKNNMKECRS